MTTPTSARALSIRARELGRQLRSAQEQSGLNGKTLARRLGWSETRLCRVFSGRASSGEVDVSALLAVCGITGERRSAILRLCRPNADPDVLRLAADEHVAAYITHAAEASALFEYQPNMVPWVAQVPDYARSVVATWHGVSDERVSNLLAMTSLLSRPGVTLLLHEWALRNPVATADVMSDQTHPLLRLSVRTNVSIRVIPLDRAVISPTAGGFTLTAFPDHDPFIYREEPAAGVFIGGADEVAKYEDLRRALCASALDNDESRNLLTLIAHKYSKNE